MIDVDFFTEAAAESCGGLSAVVAGEEHELTEIEIEELLEKAADLQAAIDAEQKRLDDFIAHYNAKIERARENFAKATAPERLELAEVTNRLDRWARRNITGKKRSIDLPSGRLSLTKQQPLFYINGDKVTGDNPALIELARRVDTDLIKVQTVETADWAKFKKRLALDESGNVCIEETGEVLADMRVELRPDKFDFKTA